MQTFQDIFQFYTNDSKPPKPKYFLSLTTSLSFVPWTPRTVVTSEGRGESFCDVLHSQLLLLELCLLYYQCGVVNIQPTSHVTHSQKVTKSALLCCKASPATCQSFQHFGLYLIEGLSCKMRQLLTLPLPLQSSPLLSLKKCLQSLKGTIINHSLYVGFQKAPDN